MIINLMVYPIGDGNLSSASFVECILINLMVYPIGDGNGAVIL